MSSCLIGLPPDTLGGHRDRFLKQYKDLKRFYFNSGNLQYFKNLIKVPSLPNEPPDFLVAANLASHVRPEAVMSEPEPEPEPEDAPIDLLVDTMESQQNGAPPMPDERDVMIQQLMAEVTRLKEELTRVHAENQMMAESLYNRIQELEQDLQELKQIAESTQQENEVLRTALKDGEKNQDAAGRLLAMEKIAKANDDKFKKIKDMYTRIKAEHVTMIRKHADASKSLAVEKKEKEELEKDTQGLQQQVAELRHEKSTVEASLEQSSAENLAEILAANNVKDLLSQEKESLEADLVSMTTEKDQTQTQYNELEEEQQKSQDHIKSLEGELGVLRQAKGDTDSSYKQEMEKHIEARDKIQHLETDLESLTRNRDGLQNDHTDLQTEHTTSLNTIKTLETSLEETTKAKQETEVHYEEEQKQHSKSRDHIQSLKTDLDDMTTRRDEAVNEAKDWKHKQEQALDKIQSLENTLSGVQGEKADTDSAYKQEQDEKQQALTQIQTLMTQLADMTRQRDESQSQCRELDTKNTAAYSRIQSVEQSLSDMTTNRDEVLALYTTEQQQHTQANGKIQCLETELLDMTSQRNKWQQDHGHRTEQHSQAVDRIQCLDTDLLLAREEHSSLQAAHEDLQNNHRQAQLRIEGLTSELKSVKASETNLNSRLKSTADELSQFQTKSQDLSMQLAALEAARAALHNSLTQSQSSLNQSQQDLDQSRTDMDRLELALRQEINDYRKHMLVSAVEEAESIIKDAMSQSDNPHISTITCTAEYLMDRANPVLQTITELRDSVEAYNQDPQMIASVVKSVCEFSHRMGDVIVFGYATSHAAPIEEGEALSEECRACGDGSMQLLGTIKQEQYNKVPGASDHIDTLVKRILTHAEALLPKVEDVKAEQMGDMIDQEMQQTTEAIAKAAEKIARMLAQSREKYTGIKLEVNERILDSCNALMRAIMTLVDKSKNLQREIVSQGRGTASAKDFYKKHHRWTEGLISAAKAVGWGANVLCEAADKAVRGEGKFEELMVCSQEIAASTTQLVVSSKVKAARGSENLASLALASRGVTECTGRVVASAKSGADAIEEIDAMDFSKLTLHQSKRLEMESQVKVLELESNLEKERRRLGDLRKTHYRLAGESEGWEQGD